jgi:hypothetical protein
MTRQRSTLLATVLTFVAVVLVLQLWLFVAAQHGALDGDPTAPLVSALVSALCFLGVAVIARALPR